MTETSTRKIDPAAVRQIATEIMLDHARDIEHLTIHERLSDYGLSPEDEHKHAVEIHELIDTATVTVAFPEATAP